jgi:hypothetical protein
MGNVGMLKFLVVILLEKIDEIYRQELLIFIYLIR